MCWQLLLGYLPSNPEWRADTLQRKRREYWASVPQYFDVDDAERSQYQKDTLHQVLPPLTNPNPHHSTFTAHHSPFTPNLTPTLTLTLTLTRLHQILMDVPRTSPSSRLLHHEVSGIRLGVG